MNSQKSTPEEILKKSIELTDLLSELNELIEKIHILSDDVCDNHIEKISFIALRRVILLCSDIRLSPCGIVLRTVKGEFDG